MQKTLIQKGQLQAIKKAFGLIKPNSSILPILGNCFVENEQLNITNLDTYLIIKNVPIDGRFLLPYRTLLKMFDMIPGFTTEMHGDTHIKFIGPDETESFMLAVDNIQDYIKFPDTADSVHIGVITEADKARLLKAANYVSRDELRPAMCLVAFRAGYIAATDAHLLYFEKSDLQPAPELLIKKNAIKLLEIFGKAKNLSGEPDLFTISKNDKNIIFENTQVKIISRLSDDKYPQFEAVIPTEFFTTIEVPKAYLVPIIKKAIFIANNVTKQVIFDIKAKEFTISASDDLLGAEYCKNIDDYQFAGNDLRIRFNANFVLKCLNTAVGDTITIKFVNPSKAAVMNDSILMMPCN